MPNLNVRTASPSDYNSLPHIDLDHAGEISVGDWSCLAEVGGLLVRERAHERFGVTLLHRHFMMREGEVLVETYDETAGSIVVRPEKPEAGRPVATSVYFGSGIEAGVPPRLVGVEFVPCNDNPGYVPLHSQDAAILASVGDILARHGKLRRFGIRLLYDPLSAQPSLIRMETCDEVARTLTTRTIPKEQVDAASSVTTVFRWKPSLSIDGCELASAQECVPHQQCHAPTGTHQSVSWHSTKG